ncbi:MAG TPA: citrate synthase [Tepidisphaeraceae bacterium]|jgi:citrate synthase|nr:citrate synthase [Tepidisphaeraceae bacterium]
MPRTATLSIDDKSLVLPVIEGSEGEVGIDISQLRAKTGAITFDHGFGNTGACTSAITFIDGDLGILRYRGYPIEQLATKSTFIEVAWLLIFGELPTSGQREGFSARLTANASLHESFKHHFQGFPTDAPPMAMLSAMINTLGCFHPQFNVLETEEEFEDAAARLISKVRTIVAAIYRIGQGLPINYPDPNLKYVANFLHMMFSNPHEPYEADADILAALNLILILHADHEQNCSTSTVRVVGSSKAPLFASCAAGVNALWGPLHGGANVEVLEQLEAIHKGGMTADDAVAKAKDKASGFRLMGFGHRVYKNFDPRAKILREIAERVLNKLKINDPLLDIARRLEELALKDPYFVDRKLYPNVDFYSGIIMKAIGIPVNMFTTMFAIGRMPGWIAQWREQNNDPAGRIARPRQIYTGARERNYVPMAERVK